MKGDSLFFLTEEHRSVQETFRRFSRERVAPVAGELDEVGTFPKSLFLELGELGLFGLRYPESLGGSQCDLTAFCLAIREVASGSLSLAAAGAMQSLMGTHFLSKFGNREIQERLFRPALRGEEIGTICITEPDAGSDLSAIKTSAIRVREGYELTGQKMWITSATEADFFTVMARVDGKLTIFLVEKDFRGVKVGRSIPKMGCWASPTSEVAFDKVFVPLDHRLGDEGQGEGELRKILGEIRIMTGALAIGVARAALEESIKYSEQRVQFKKPIAAFQAIQMMIAEMKCDLAASEALVFQTAGLYDRSLEESNAADSRGDEELLRSAAIAKLFATERAVSICDKATRIFGSYGYAMEYPVQRYFRDIRFTLYGGGTSEILKTFIGRR